MTSRYIELLRIVTPSDLTVISQTKKRFVIIMLFPLMSFTGCNYSELIIKNKIKAD